MGENQLLLVLAQLDGRGQRPLHLGQIVLCDKLRDAPFSFVNVATVQRGLLRVSIFRSWPRDLAVPLRSRLRYVPMIAFDTAAAVVAEPP